MSNKTSEVVCPECAIRNRVPRDTRRKKAFCGGCKHPLLLGGTEPRTKTKPVPDVTPEKEDSSPSESTVNRTPPTRTKTADTPTSQIKQQLHPSDLDLNSDVSGVQELDYESLMAHPLSSDEPYETDTFSLASLNQSDPVRLPEGGYRTLTRAEYDALHSSPPETTVGENPALGICDECGADISGGGPEAHREYCPVRLALLRSEILEPEPNDSPLASASAEYEQPDMLGPFRFGDWPVGSVPAVAAGVYEIWEQDQLMYVGMSGRGRSQEDLAAAEASRQKVGLWTRLNSHASGRRSGDQFCVYVADRLVLQTLTLVQLDLIAAGELRLDDLVRRRVREQMTFTFTTTPDGETAARLEGQLRAGAGGSKPLLNPA